MLFCFVAAVAAPALKSWLLLLNQLLSAVAAAAYISMYIRILRGRQGEVYCSQRVVVVLQLKEVLKLKFIT